MTNTNSTTGRKALATLIRESAAEIGMSISVVADPTGQGRLMAGVEPDLADPARYTLRVEALR